MFGKGMVSPYIIGFLDIMTQFCEKTIKLVNELGGTMYVFVVDRDVAKNELGFKIGENFFTKDPVGWSLIFIAGFGVIYLGLKLTVFKKRVKVLK